MTIFVDQKINYYSNNNQLFHAPLVLSLRKQLHETICPSPMSLTGGACVEGVSDIRQEQTENLKPRWKL